MSKQTLCVDTKINTVEKLIDVLNEFKTSGVNYININVNGVPFDNVSLDVELTEEILTDDSKAYDITLRIAEK